jgi:outer membrane protein assembly factor BamB/tetratricopeptide (TPR) repeat protein
MSLKGNLGSVDLANIFQMLSINQKEGTLIIADGSSRKSIYFSRDGVSMLSRGKVRQDSLGRILLRYNRITPDQLQRALEKQTSSNRLLGEILEEMGVVNRTDVENALRVQIEEEIYNLFIWKNAEFEFVEGDPSQVFDDLERPITKLTFNVNALIMEAARRIDEWEYIRSRVTSTREILRFTGKRADLSDEVFQTPFAEKVLQSVDGHANVLEIVERSYVNKFEVCKLLALLLDQEALEPVPAEDLRALAANAARDGDDRAVVKFLQRILDDGDLDAELHLGLARAFENLGELEKAACHHKLYGECRLEDGAVPEAVEAYTHIRDILPTDLYCRERRLEILLEHGKSQISDPGEVLAEAREVATILSEIGQSRKAVGVLARAVALVPDDLEARNQLAALDLQAGFTSEAITEFRHIAAAKRARNDLEGAARIYRRILALDRRQEEVLQELETLVSAKKRRAAQRRRVFLTAVVTVLAGIAVYAVLLYELRARGSLEQGEAEARALFATHEATARRTLSRIEEELSTLRAEPETDPVAQLDRAREFRQRSDECVRSAMKLYEDVIERFPYSASRNEAARRIRELSDIRKEADEIEEKARRRVQRRAMEEFQFGCELSAAGHLSKALDHFRMADRLTTDRSWADSSAVELRERIRQHEAILREAEDLLARAEDLIRQGHVEEASSILVRLLKTHAFHEITERIRLPIQVTSRPSGAEVRCAGQETLRTPATLRYRPHEGLEVNLGSPGFEATPLRIDPIDSTVGVETVRKNLRTRLHVDLRKGCAWKTAVGGAVEAAPLVDEDRVYVGSRSGRLSCLSVEDGRVLWSIELPALGGLTTSPRLWQGLVLIATSNPDAIVAVDPRTRQVTWKYDADGNLGKVSAPPVTLGSTLVAVDQSGLVVRFDLLGGRPRTWWRRRPGAAVRGGPVVAGELLLVPSVDGNVYELEPRTGGTRRRYRVGAPVSASPVVTDGLLLVPASDGRLRAFELGTGALAWTARSGGELRSSPVVASDRRILFGALDGVLRVIDRDLGQPVSAFRTRGPLAAVPLVAGASVYAASHDGCVYACRLNGDDLELRWSYETGARITARPVVAAGLVLVASEDGHLYALSP